MRLQDLNDRVLRSERWHRKTAARASDLASVFRALQADLDGRDLERTKDGAGRWTFTALDAAGARVLVAIVSAPIPRTWSDAAPVELLVHRADLLASGAVRRLGEADRRVDAPPGKGPQRAHHAPAGRDQEHEGDLDTSGPARDHNAGKGRV